MKKNKQLEGKINNYKEKYFELLKVVHEQDKKIDNILKGHKQV